MNTKPAIFNICLIFDDIKSRLFENYSSSLSKSFSSDFTLGAASLPHLTVVQFEASEQIAKSAFNKTIMAVGNQFEVSLMGVTLIPTKEGTVWIELLALKTEKLKLLHQTAIEAVGGLSIHSGIGDSYRPHITIARMIDGCVMPQFRLDENVIRMKNLSCKLALGISGPNFQLETLL